MRSRLTVAGRTLNLETIATGKSVEISVLPANNSPHARAAMMAELERSTEDSDWRGFELKISNLGYRHENALVGWLRAAYIVAFAKLGYRYVARPQLNVVRQQITQPERRVLKAFILTNLQLQKGDHQILVIRRPEWLMHCFAVPMGRHLVFLPGLERRVNVYRRLARYRSTNSELEVSGHVLPWPTGPEFTLDFASPALEQ